MTRARCARGRRRNDMAGRRAMTQRPVISCVLISAMVTVSGCASGPGSLQSRYGDTTDVCYVDRQPLIETESRFSESMIAGGIGGAALGAGLGALLSGGSGRGAAWGALAGGLSGLVGGYLYAKQQQAQTREQLLAS